MKVMASKMTKHSMAKVAAVSILALFPGFSVFAQKATTRSHGAENRLTSTHTLKLENLIRQALENNQELRAFESEVRSEEAQVGPAGSLNDPMLGVNAMNFPADSFSRTETDMTGIEVSLSQEIPFPGKRAKLREAATHSARAKKELYEQKKWQITKRVKDVFYELYLSYQRQALLEDQRTILRQILAASRNQYALGKTPQAAVLSLQVEEANLIEELLRAESDIRVKFNELSHLLGHVGEHVSGRPEKIEKTNFNLDNWTEEKVVAFVMENNPKLKALGAAVQAEEARLSYAKKGYLPDFQVMVGYTFREPTRMGGEGKDFVSAGVGISLPIWAGSKQSEQIKGAVADRTKAQAEYQDMRLMLEHEARAAFAELKEAKKRIELFEGGLLQLTRQAVASGRSAYLTGKIDYASLLESLRTQYKTQFAYQEALAKHEAKIAQLEALAAQNLGAR